MRDIPTELRSEIICKLRGHNSLKYSFNIIFKMACQNQLQIS